jgi:hypothetical protein
MCDYFVLAFFGLSQKEKDKAIPVTGREGP